MPAPPISAIPRTRLVDDVTDQLRELILSEQLPPGQQLRQIELSEQLGISRTPLREAIRILQADGLVKVSNGNNTVEVIDYTQDDLVALYEVREVLDGLAARLVADERDLKVAPLRATVADMRRAIKRGDVGQFDQRHAELHHQMYELSGNEQLRGEIPLVRVSTLALARLLRRAAAESGLPDDVAPAGRATALAQDEALLDAIEIHDGRLAERLAREHVAEMVSAVTTRR